MGPLLTSSCNDLLFARDHESGSDRKPDVRGRETGDSSLLVAGPPLPPGLMPGEATRAKVAHSSVGKSARKITKSGSCQPAIG